MYSKKFGYTQSVRVATMKRVSGMEYQALTMVCARLDKVLFGTRSSEYVSFGDNGMGKTVVDVHYFPIKHGATTERKEKQFEAKAQRLFNKFYREIAPFIV